MKKNRRKNAQYTQANFFLIAAGYMLVLYIYLLTCLYPFLIKPGYEVTSITKYGFLVSVSYGFNAGPFWIPTFIPISLFFILAGTVCYVRKSEGGIRQFVRSLRFSSTDIFVALYAFFAIISAITTPYRSELIWGSFRWFMGLASQFLFVFIYFISSRFFNTEDLRELIYASFAASTIVFVIGILQRFGLDIFDLYHGHQNKLFISTIGQHTYFSSFMILFYVLGIYVFWISDPGSVLHKAAAVFVVIASCIPCILNADMIFSGLFFALSFLFIMSFDSTDRMKAFWRLVLIILLTWKLTGVVWYLAEPEFRLEPLSKFIMLSPYTWIPVVCVALICMFVYRKDKGKERFYVARYRYVGYMYAILLVFVIGACIIYIALNTTKVLPENLRSDANYLLFDAFWGNGRGAIWHDTVVSFFSELRQSPVTAILGAGPDRFYQMITDYAHEWIRIYTDETVANAHNEWLNAFINYGVFGGASYLCIFLSSIVRCIRKRDVSPAALGAGTIAVAYIAHQFFGYQQYISTPYIFLILGIAEQFLRTEEKTLR